MKKIASKTFAAGSAVLALAACGGEASTAGEPDAGGDSQVDDGFISAQVESETAGLVTNKRVNAFDFRVSSDEHLRSQFSPERIKFTGDCRYGGEVKLGFQDAVTIGKPEWFMIIFEGDNAPGPGETGTYALEKVVWTNGTVPGSTSPRPNPYKGSGTWTVEEHSGNSMDGRMKAQVTADLTGPSGEQVSIKLLYDINHACTEPR